MASLVIDRLIYGFHPMACRLGTAASLQSITRDDFVAFHRRYFVPNNALVAVVGDITSAEAMAGLEKAFGDWARAEVPPFDPIAPPEPTRRVVVIDRPDAVQTEIRVGHLGIPRKHDDFETLNQTVKILGGEGANRLQQVLRSQRQLTYGASADLDAYKWAGAVVAATDTQTATTAEALRVVVDEFARLQRERVHEAELEAAQDYAVGHFPLTIETPDQIATQVLNYLFYELPVDDLPKYRDRVLSVSPDDIQRAARWFVRPDQLSVVLVGNASEFIDSLKASSAVERVPITASTCCRPTSSGREGDALVRRAVRRPLRGALVRALRQVGELRRSAWAASSSRGRRDLVPTSMACRSPGSPRRCACCRARGSPTSGWSRRRASDVPTCSCWSTTRTSTST